MCDPRLCSRGGVSARVGGRQVSVRGLSPGLSPQPAWPAWSLHGAQAAELPRVQGAAGGPPRPGVQAARAQAEAARHHL